MDTHFLKNLDDNKLVSRCIRFKGWQLELYCRGLGSSVIVFLLRGRFSSRCWGKNFTYRCVSISHIAEWRGEKSQQDLMPLAY